MTTTRKYTKAQARSLAARLADLLRSFGAVAPATGSMWAGWHEFEVPTKFGPYSCRVEVKDTSATIFGRFTGAVPPPCANPHTGKYNMHHFASQDTPADVLTFVRRELEGMTDPAFELVRGSHPLYRASV